MSIDVFFQSAQFDDSGRNSPLAAAERDAVETLFKRMAPSGPNAHGCWVLQVSDGGRAEVFARDLGEGCMFALLGFTPELVRLLFDVLVAGNWVMLPALEGCGAIAASAESFRAVPDGFPPVTVCKSATMLSALLEGASGA